MATRFGLHAWSLRHVDMRSPAAQPVRHAGVFTGNKPRAIKKMPRGPPPREAKIVKSVAMPEHMKKLAAAKKAGSTGTAAGAGAGAAQQGTDSVVTAWQNSKERTQGLTTAEKRVAMFAVISMLVGFAFFKTTALRVQQETQQQASDSTTPSDAPSKS
eukprot:m.100375 g.100375  ORF g.100375 m.100375 type:complete len:158 (+) comp10345_c0_seq6:81-554(+)